MCFRSPFPSFGLRKTVTHVLAILLPMCWPCFVTHVLASDPPVRLHGFYEVAGRVSLNGATRPTRGPSRGPALGYGSGFAKWTVIAVAGSRSYVRTARRAHRPNNVIEDDDGCWLRTSRNLFGSLAPPNHFSPFTFHWFRAGLLNGKREWA